MTSCRTQAHHIACRPGRRLLECVVIVIPQLLIDCSTTLAQEGYDSGDTTTGLVIGFCSAVIVIVAIRIVWPNAQRSVSWLRSVTKVRPSIAENEVNTPASRSSRSSAGRKKRRTTSEENARQRSHASKQDAEGSPKLFISYRRDDSADVVGRVYDRLVENFGTASVFKDVDSIPLGIDFRSYLDKAIAKCDIVLVVIGPHWLQASDTNGDRRLDDPRDVVRIEVECALRRNIPVVPVLVRGQEMPLEQSLPESLSSLTYRNAISVRADPDFNNDMTRLIEGVTTTL